MDNIRAQWMSHLNSTAPADRQRAEAGLRRLYAGVGLPEPKLFFWFGSPFRAAGATALLAGIPGSLWGSIIDAMERAKSTKSWLETLRGDMRIAASAPDWNAVVKATGISLTPGLAGFGGAMKSLQAPLTMARIKMYPDVGSSAPVMNENDPLYKAEHAHRSVLSGQAQWSGLNPLLGQSFYNLMTYATFAKDETQLAGREPPPVLAGLWEVAKSAGLWWPFEKAVVISERPTELHLDELSRPHHGDKPAVIFPDGERAWAWEGRAMRQEWIETPEKISPREFKQFEKSFREYMTKRTGGTPAKPQAKKPGKILAKELSGAVDEKIAALRDNNKGSLPLFDRYMNGEHEKVWAELMALGPSVRQDPFAADALAVAYETMRRVETNVKTVTSRLRQIGYRFAREPHRTPDKKVFKALMKIEKAVGTLPLSLRAFYEVVGSVDWTGQHPVLARKDDGIAADPLVVFGTDDALGQIESFDEGGQDSIAIAPDDLHKANVSGGAPYEIAVPEAAADGRVLNERHNLNFVEYLRLVFRHGGFPGFHGIGDSPKEIAELSRDLLVF